MPANIRFQQPMGANAVNLRCPACHRMGTFHSPAPNFNDMQFIEVTMRNEAGAPLRQRHVRYGARICPNLDCGQPVFVIQAEDGSTRSFPVETIDFNPENIPARILSSFEEAIKCHANCCFKASALMVRRTLEEVCQDRDAKGPNLKERIASLGAKVVIPKELLEAADELRLLGNDAAHMEAKIYDDVGDEEVTVAIELCKEILKGVYQLSGLVDRLKKLKK